jgi:hypothetical protein
MSIRVTQVGALVLRSQAKSVPVVAKSIYGFSNSAVGGRTFSNSAVVEYLFAEAATSTVVPTYFYVGAATTFVVNTDTAVLMLRAGYVASYARFKFSVIAGGSRGIAVVSYTPVVFTPNSGGGRDIFVSASSGYGMVTDETVRDTVALIEVDQSYVMTTDSSATAIGPFGASVYLISVLALASVFSPADQTVPATSDIAAGPQIVLFSGISGEFPLCFVEASNGTVLAANGIDPMLRWDGFSLYAERAGVDPPSSPIVATGHGAGLLTGRRWAIQRFIDRHGNISNPGPVSDPFQLGVSGVITGVSVDSSGVVTCFSKDHGLATNDTITIGGLVGIPVSGVFGITLVDQDYFIVRGVVVSPGMVLMSPGWWVKGSAQVNYTVPAPADPKIARRQVLRTLDGNASVFYVDIDTDDVSGTDFVSTLDDQVLSAQEALPQVFDDQMPAARRFGVPPSHKSVVVYHIGRVFAAVDQPYSKGSIEVKTGSSVVHGIGVRWPASFAGRQLIVEGGSRPYVISEARDGEYLFLGEPYADATSPFALYLIRPSDIERRLVYNSEPNSPEAWPAWNAFSVPEHSDELTGLVVLNTFLYLVEQRHISSFTFKADPGRDGFIFLKSHRGCVNNRCMVTVEDVVYMLDEAGIHRFNGENSEHVSAKIHNLFNDPNYPYRVDWAADRTLWHACADPVNEVIYWFIDFQGQEALTHAICYDYRRDRFWLESYAESVTASTSATLGHRRVLAGTTARRIIVLDEGVLDGVGADLGTAAKAILGSTPTSLEIDPGSTPFPENLSGVPLVITSGPAKGQRSVISTSSDFAVEVVDQFPVQPGPGDIFQVGGIPWKWRGTFLPYVDETVDNPRDVSVIFKPTENPGSFDLRVYFDYQESPQTWGNTRSVDGVSYATGSPDITVDTKQVRGYAIQHIAGRRDRYARTNYFVQTELQGVQAIDPTRIYEVILAGAEWQGGGNG